MADEKLSDPVFEPYRDLIADGQWRNEKTTIQYVLNVPKDELIEWLELGRWWQDRS